MQTRLNQLCAGVDRTADMGPFPHDQAVIPLITNSSQELMGIVDSTAQIDQRDRAMWELVYRETPENRLTGFPDLLYTIAAEANEAVLRRSASWGLLKLGETELLAQCLRSTDDGNVHSWKQSLIYESQGRTDWVDPRPVRVITSEFGYNVTLPLTIHGMVQFRVRRPSSGGGTGSLMSGLQGSQGDYPSASRNSSKLGNYGYGNSLQLSSLSTGTGSESEYDWYYFAAGPIAQRQLVGDLTAAVGAESFYDNLIIQKVCTDPTGNGLDHVQGYHFGGLSRSIGGNAYVHYYTSAGPQPLYLSGHIGDKSEGVIDVETQLSRHAETHIVTHPSIPYPFVQSVRGLFFGPSRMNTIVVDHPDTPLNNLLQIVRDPYSNGWFFGEFRSVLVDVDGDDVIELNGMEMYTNLEGTVVNRTPPGPQPSIPFVR